MFKFIKFIILSFILFSNSFAKDISWSVEIFLDEYQFYKIF